MAVRPVFLTRSDPPFWRSTSIEFNWHPGLSHAQKQRSITSLHDAALDQVPVSRILEVSSKSTSETGKKLSAFNLIVDHPDFGGIPLESAFQGSKVFRLHGQLFEAYASDPRTAKGAAKEVNGKDHLIGFRWNNQDWPLEPKTWFYDWLYITAVLHSIPEAPAQIRRYDAFTDIEFNPKKSFNCQARSCAIIASTVNNEELRSLIKTPESMIQQTQKSTLGQARLF